MEPTIRAGQIITVDETAYRSARDVHRGDVVALRSPVDPAQLIVKRIVGLPGDRVEIGSDGVTVNGRALAPSTADDAPARCAGGARDVTVPADSFYVLGDNLCGSRDGRHFGPVPFSSLRGRVAPTAKS